MNATKSEPEAGVNAVHEAEGEVAAIVPAEHSSGAATAIEQTTAIHAAASDQTQAETA